LWERQSNSTRTIGSTVSITLVCESQKRLVSWHQGHAGYVSHSWINSPDGVFHIGGCSAFWRKSLSGRIAKHATHTAQRCQSLTTKTITPHVLRHTAAMRLLHAGIGTTVIALWLGHEQVETTQMYLHADLALKEPALARTKPLDSKPGRCRPPDALLGFLDGL
jgi:integrase/recombinase XerD